MQSETSNQELMETPSIGAYCSGCQLWCTCMYGRVRRNGSYWRLNQRHISGGEKDDTTDNYSYWRYDWWVVTNSDSGNIDGTVASGHSIAIAGLQRWWDDALALVVVKWYIYKTLFINDPLCNKFSKCYLCKWSVNYWIFEPLAIPHQNHPRWI